MRGGIGGLHFTLARQRKKSFISTLARQHKKIRKFHTRAAARENFLISQPRGSARKLPSRNHAATGEQFLHFTLARQREKIFSFHSRAAAEEDA